VKGLKQCHHSLKAIIYSNRTSKIDKIKDILYKFGSSNPQKKFQITDKIFYKHFKIAHSA
jgi:hypothetical protein